MSTRYEYYITGENYVRAVYDPYYNGQTFTPSIAHKITSVKLLLYRLGSPGTVTVSIRATDEGLPTGGDLCSGTTNGNTLTTNEAGEWREITLGDGYNLEADTQYAIVVKVPFGDVNNRVNWLADDSPTYPGGNRVYSEDSGSSWYSSDVVFMFEEWGDPLGETYDETARLQVILVTQSRSDLATFTDIREQIILAVQSGDAYPPFFDEKGRTQIILAIQGESDLATFVNIHEQVILAVQEGNAYPPPYNEEGRLQVILAVVSRADTHISYPYISLPFKYVVEIRDGSDNLVAMLENAYQVSYDEVINAPHALRFCLPSDDAKLTNITLANQLWLRDVKTGLVVRRFRLQRELDVRQ